MARKDSKSLSLLPGLRVPYEPVKEKSTRTVSVVVDNRSASPFKQGANTKYDVHLTVGVQGQFFCFYQLVADKVAPGAVKAIELKVPPIRPTELWFFWNDGTPKAPLYRAVSGREAETVDAWNSIILQFYGFQYGTQIYETAGAAFVNMVG